LTPILIIRHPSNRLAERRYIFQVVFGEFLGLAIETVEDPLADAVRIHAADDPERSVVVPDRLLATEPDAWLTARSLPQEPLQTTTKPREAQRPGGDPKLPVPFGFHPNRWDTGEPYEIPFDLFGCVFYFLTGYEEATVAMRDEHGRFPSQASLLGRCGFLGRPLVDEYVEVLWHVIHARWPSLERRRRTYRLVPTHDVDWPFVSYGRPLREVAEKAIGDIVHRRGWRVAYRRLVSRLRHDPFADPANTFGFLMDQSEKHGVESEFLFVTGRSSSFDVNYNIDDPPIQTIMREIHSRGHWIGLHASYSSQRSERQLKDEFSRLLTDASALGIRQETWGSRMHYLRWQHGTTWPMLDAAGVDYDSTLGFADHVGFRAGTCREFPVFDLVQTQPLKLREKPLIAMDQTLLHPAYMHQRKDGVLGWIESISRECRNYAGSFVILWHNSTLISSEDRRLYAEILEISAP
jgi:hypothetical protein